MRWLPVTLLGAAGVLGAAAAAEQITSKVAEVQQYGILMQAGQSPVAGFAVPHAELSSAQQADVAQYQNIVDSHHRNRDRDIGVGLLLTEAALIAGAARSVIASREQRITTLPYTA